MTFRVGQKVTFTSYGKPCQSTVARISRDGKILFFPNGRWMHSISCTPCGK